MSVYGLQRIHRHLKTPENVKPHASRALVMRTELTHFCFFFQLSENYS